MKLYTTVKTIVVDTAEGSVCKSVLACQWHKSLSLLNISLSSSWQIEQGFKLVKSNGFLKNLGQGKITQTRTDCQLG